MDMINNKKDKKLTMNVFMTITFSLKKLQLMNGKYCEYIFKDPSNKKQNTQTNHH